MLHKLEDILSTTQDAAAHFAWAQSFEYVPSGKTKKESLLKTRAFMGENKYRYAEHPYGLHEIASETPFSQEFTYSDDFMLVRREESGMTDEDEDFELKEGQSPALQAQEPIDEEADEAEEFEDEEPEAPQLDLKIWVVESEGEYTVFNSRAEALEAAEGFVTSGAQEAVVFTAIATELVSAVVQRTVVVSDINKNAP